MITDADVQAAARVLSGRETTTGRDRREAAAVLDAVAPAIIRRAKAEALREVVEENAISIPDALGYKVRAVFVEDLLEMAAEHERGFGK